MKSFVLLLFLLVTALAQSNAPCALKLPFEIEVSINGTGTTSSESNLPHYTPPPPYTSVDDGGLTIRIDTTIPGSIYSFNGDSLIFFDTLPDQVYQGFSSTNVKMHFDTLTSRATIYIDRSNQYSTVSAGDPVSYHTEMSLSSASLRYTSDSFDTYGPVPYDSVGLSDFDFHVEDFTNIGLGEYSTITGTRFDSGTVEILGQTVPLAFVAPTRPILGLAIYSVKGILQCGITSSDQSRTLELYTPLGANVASFEIAPGQTELILPHLQGGLYFVRLDGSVLKIAVP